MLLNLDTLSTDMLFLNKNLDSGYYIQVYSNGQVYIRYGSAGGLVGSTGDITTGSSQYIVTTFSSGTVRLYVDLADKGSVVGSAPSGMTGPLYLGTLAGASHFCVGVMDETRISDTSRSLAWLSASNQSNWNTLITFSTAGTVSGTTYYFDGFVKELNTPVQRTLYLYRRDSGLFLGATTSSGDGGYYIETEYTGNHFVVCVDDEDGVQYEDLIISRALPHSKGWTHGL